MSDVRVSRPLAQAAVIKSSGPSLPVLRIGNGGYRMGETIIPPEASTDILQRMEVLAEAQQPARLIDDVEYQAFRAFATPKQKTSALIDSGGEEGFALARKEPVEVPKEKLRACAAKLREAGFTRLAGRISKDGIIPTWFVAWTGRLAMRMGPKYKDGPMALPDTGVTGLFAGEWLWRAMEGEGQRELRHEVSLASANVVEHASDVTAYYMRHIGTDNPLVHREITMLNIFAWLTALGFEGHGGNLERRIAARVQRAVVAAVNALGVISDSEYPEAASAQALIQWKASLSLPSYSPYRNDMLVFPINMFGTTPVLARSMWAEWDTRPRYLWSKEVEFDSLSDELKAQPDNHDRLMRGEEKLDRYPVHSIERWNPKAMTNLMLRALKGEVHASVPVGDLCDLPPEIVYALKTEDLRVRIEIVTSEENAQVGAILENNIITIPFLGVGDATDEGTYWKLLNYFPPLHNLRITQAYGRLLGGLQLAIDRKELGMPGRWQRNLGAAIGADGPYADYRGRW